MEALVDWPCVDLLVSELSDVFDPHADAETIQEAIGMFNTKREEMKSREDSKHEMVKGTVCMGAFQR